MSERLISQLQSFLDRLKNDPRSALMFEADADTLREAMARIKSDDMKVNAMLNNADKDVIRIAALDADLTTTVQMYKDAEARIAALEAQLAVLEDAALRHYRESASCAKILDSFAQSRAKALADPAAAQAEKRHLRS